MFIQPQMFVRLISDPSRAGVVQDEDRRTMAGEEMAPVQFGDGSISWLPVRALEPVERAPKRLADRFADGRFVEPAWLRRSLTRIRVTGRLSEVVYSMEATDTDFYAFQFKPVLKLLGSPTDALLIADEVGLGKTIEAGLIWTELRARFESNRLLVVCPKTLCEKWRVELDRRFGVDARIVKAGELLQLLTERGIGARGFAAIASMPSLRPSRGWDTQDERNHAASPDTRRRLARMLDEEASGDPLIDLLVVDEAHHMRNPETLTNRLGQLLNAVSAHRVFLSATPIHLRSRDLHSLLRLLDPDTFEYRSTIKDLIRTNEPIVAARDLLLKSDSSRGEILERIEGARHFQVLAGSRTLELLRADLEDGPLDPASRARLASRLESVNQMAHYMTRTRRRDVEDLRIVREPVAPVLNMHPVEREFYDAATEEVDQYAADADVNAGFLLSTPQRMLTSSPAAASAYWAGFADSDLNDIEETDDDRTWEDEELHPLRDRLSVLSRDLDRTGRLEEVDTKLALLRSEFRRLWESEPLAKVIVFSSFKPTLNYLHRRLGTDGVRCELLHGSVREPRETILDRFRDHPNACVLLSSEVGSEGIDLQFCHTVFNYDLPWNPMRVEQRIGRVDRLGQSSRKVTIVNLIYGDTIDARIYERLYERLQLIQRTLGEFEAVLGEPIRKMAKRLLSPGLTEEQQEQIIDQTAQAMEYRRLDEKRLEQEAGALIRHGDYILRKIEESRNRRRWLRGEDVFWYVKDRLHRSFANCRIEADPPGSGAYRISLSTRARADLSRFIARRNLQGKTRLLHNDARQRYKFTRSVARNVEHGIECISQLHPLVRFAVDQDRRDAEAGEPQPVAARIAAGRLPFDCVPDIYVIAIRRLDTDSTSGRGGGSRLIHVGASLNDFRPMSPEQAEEMAYAVADDGRLLPNFRHDPRLPAAARLLRDRVLPESDRLYADILKHTKAQIEDRAAIQERALRRHHATKTRQLTQQREKLRRDADSARASGNRRRFQQLGALVSATGARIRKLDETIDLRLKQITEQRTFVPEWSDVACLLVEVAG